MTTALLIIEPAGFAFIVVPAWLLGLPMEALAVYRVLSAFMAIVEHANVKLWQPLDTALSLVVGTPNMRKLHHSRHESERTRTTETSCLCSIVPSARSLRRRAPSSSTAGSRIRWQRVQRFGGLLSLPFRRPESSAASSAARPLEPRRPRKSGPSWRAFAV